MSDKSDVLENAVADLLQAYAHVESSPSTRSRAAADRGFARLLRLLAPRIRYFIARYGLGDMREDAEQACALALHRAVAAYDPGQARFTTFINWQLRGELQGLRFRMRTDSRGAARKMSALTLSFESLRADDGTPFEQMIRDEDAEARTASGAADLMAARVAERLIEQWQGASRGKALARATTRPATRRRAGEGALASLPKFVRCRPGTVAPQDLAMIEARLAREGRIARDYLCGTGGGGAPTIDAGIREQERPVLRRALREMALLAITGRSSGTRATAQIH